MASMNEMDYFLLSRPDLADNSMRTYRKNYANLSDMMNSDMINEETQVDIYNKIKEVENPNSQQMLINIAMMIKKFHKNKYDYLEKKRDLIREDIKEKRNIRKKDKKDELPDFKDLQRFTREMLSENNHRAYIINYILTEYNTRNKDLDIVIVDDLPTYRKMKKDDKENILFASNSGKNYFTRSSYKTRRKYGQLNYQFSNKKFSRNVKSYIEEQREKGVENVYLLSKDDGERIGEDSLSHYITRFTLNNMTESDYNKISVSRIKSMEQYNLLKQISERRPTSLQTLVEEYSLIIDL
tara:strand:+ start:812 stop:1702 length:891 start_codon:yes stop_codon:yes gene_type:complete